MLQRCCTTPAARAHVCSRASFRTAAVTVHKRTHTSHRSPAYTPVISYSTAKEDIPLNDLAALYVTAARQTGSQPSTPLQQALLAHWQGATDEAFQQRLRKLIHHSIAIAAAYTRDGYFWEPEDTAEDPQQLIPGSSWLQQQHNAAAGPYQADQQGAGALPSTLQQQQQQGGQVGSGATWGHQQAAAGPGSSSSASCSSQTGAPLTGKGFAAAGARQQLVDGDTQEASRSSSLSSSVSSSNSLSSSSSSSSGSSSSSWGWRWSRPRKRLVAFATAAGDCALVATVHDVLVHPRLQGRGIGSQLLKTLTSQLQAQDVWEVGCLVPSPTAPFLECSGFEPDKEQSTPMVLPAAAAASMADRAGGQWSGSPKLQALLLAKLEGRQ